MNGCKILVSFILTEEEAFSYRFYSKAKSKSIGSFK